MHTLTNKLIFLRRIPAQCL
uniref:Uncharacterized protein n=1 Tax=Arundo donax TaxID=35708 RepID=A0A0A9HKE2_ARUDO